MADDKRDGSDDLFEDLDKFFAPIRDVDWESEESTPAADTPQEEHVAVRPSEGEPIVIADEPAPDCGILYCLPRSNKTSARSQKAACAS